MTSEPDSQPSSERPKDGGTRWVRLSFGKDVSAEEVVAALYQFHREAQARRRAGRASAEAGSTDRPRGELG